MDSQQSPTRAEETESSSISKPSGNLKLILYFLGFLVLIATLVFYINTAFKTNGKSKLFVNLEGKVLEINVDNNNNIDLSVLIDKLFADDKSRLQTLTLLAHYKKIYSLDDPLLFQTIEMIDVNSKLAVELRELLTLLKGPFDRNSHRFYNFSDQIALKTAITQLHPEDNASRVMREIYDAKLGPFQEKRYAVKLEASTADDLKEGFASSCGNSYFFKNHVTIWNSDKERFTDVWVMDTIDHGCSGEDPESKYRLKISSADMAKLSGSTDSLKIEEGFARIKFN